MCNYGFTICLSCTRFHSKLTKRCPDWGHLRDAITRGPDQLNPCDENTTLHKLKPYSHCAWCEKEPDTDGSLTPTVPQPSHCSEDSHRPKTPAPDWVKDWSDSGWLDDLSLLAALRNRKEGGRLCRTWEEAMLLFPVYHMVARAKLGWYIDTVPDLRGWIEVRDEGKERTKSNETEKGRGQYLGAPSGDGRCLETSLVSGHASSLAGGSSGWGK